MRLKKACSLALLVFLSGSSVLAASHKWTTGWDNFSEPLNFKTSTVAWSVNATTGKLTVTYKLVGARPSKLYQVGVTVYCPSGSAPATFGQFPVIPDACSTASRQGVTANVYVVELGVVTTDAHGNGLLAVAVNGLAADTYNLSFDVRDGAGCHLTGGNAGACNVDFQSPGPTFGDAITITIP
jgi:hypothetical protein